MHQERPTSGVSPPTYLMTLIEVALGLLLPPMLDRLSLESYLVLVQKDTTAQLAHMPVDVSYPNSEYMVQRRIITGRCLGDFVYDSAGRANRYHSGTETAPTSKDRDLGAVGLRSLKRSLDKGRKTVRGQRSLSENGQRQDRSNRLGQ